MICTSSLALYIRCTRLSASTSSIIAKKGRCQMLSSFVMTLCCFLLVQKECRELNPSPIISFKVHPSSGLPVTFLWGYCGTCMGNVEQGCILKEDTIHVSYLLLLHCYQPPHFLLENPAKTSLISLSRMSTSNSHILGCMLCATCATIL